MNGRRDGWRERDGLADLVTGVRALVGTFARTLDAAAPATASAAASADRAGGDEPASDVLALLGAVALAGRLDALLGVFAATATVAAPDDAPDPAATGSLLR